MNEPWFASATELAELPPAPARQPPPDWLLDAAPFKAGVFRSGNPHELVLENGLVRRTFRLAPNAATVGLDHQVTGHAVLRAVRPEAEVTLDGTRHPVGGLSGQPNHAFLLPAWLDGLTADPFGGNEDIAHRSVRCVGEPEVRFEEDALRMFRALRFAARLDFIIEGRTYEAIGNKAYLAADLAAERVRDELEKTLLTAHTQRVGEMIDLGLLEKYIPGRGWAKPDFSVIAGISKKAMPRWAVFCALLEKNGYIPSAGAFLEALRLDGHTLRCCSDAALMTKSPPPADKLGWKMLLNQYGVDSVQCAAVSFDVLEGGECEKQLISILKSGECFSMKHLAVSGDDLLALGYRGPELGEMMRFLLDYVMEHPENNRRELLLSLAKVSEET